MPPESARDTETKERGIEGDGGASVRCAGEVEDRANTLDESESCGIVSVYTYDLRSAQRRIQVEAESSLQE